MEKKESENLKNEINYFPYEMYNAQVKFMDFLYEGLCKGLNDNNKIKILLMESPTGTGKTLMLLGTAMKYLSKIKNDINNNDNFEENDDDWFNDFGKNKSINKKENNISNKVDLILNKITSNLKRNKNEDNKMLIDYEENIKKEIISNPNQIFFCTRTHSQIFQVINEGKKIRNYVNEKYKTQFDFSFSFLASRKFLCINKTINNGKNNLSYINNKCNEINSESKTKCIYHSNNVEELCSKEILIDIKDIEDLFKLSEEINACPYYSCKNSIKQSDFVILPYNNLINKRIRNNLEIDINNKVIIFDEAHNIIESVLNCSNTDICYQEIFSVCFGIVIYFDKYSNRLKSNNNLNLKQLIKICNNLLSWISQQDKNNELINEKVIQLSDFYIEIKANNYDIFKLIKFIDESKLENKIQWIYEKYLQMEKEQSTISKISNLIKTQMNYNKEKELNIKLRNLYNLYISTNPLSKLSIFLYGLTNIDSDGILIYEKENSKLKYLMLNPIREFSSLITEAKLVIFAGGTMKPFEDFYSLFGKNINKENIISFEGDHIIPNGNVKGFILSNDIYANNEPFIFTFENMKKNGMRNINNLLLYIKNYYELLEENFKGKGIGIFFPSYDFINRVIKYNNEKKILSKDYIFYEENNSKDIFSLYKENIITKKKNSIIFAVMGGKLSEGINFNDDLCRILIIIGMPYSNIKSIEIREKMKYHEKISKEKGYENDYYENSCIKNINQTIGRCIRHYNDYSIIIFTDIRFKKEKIINKFPKWLTKEKIEYIENKNSYDSHIKFIKNFLIKH